VLSSRKQLEDPSGPRPEHVDPQLWDGVQLVLGDHRAVNGEPEGGALLDLGTDGRLGDDQVAGVGEDVADLGGARRRRAPPRSSPSGPQRHKRGERPDPDERCGRKKEPGACPPRAGRSVARGVVHPLMMARRYPGLGGVPDDGEGRVMDLLGRVLQSRYRLDEKLGTGGSARVYAAHDLVLERSVAVKVLHPALGGDARFVGRFLAEARAAASLQHPGIVGVFDFESVAGDLSYVVLELMEGGSLQDLLDESRSVSGEQAARLGADVCAALGFAHRRGIVHRDVKPGNILFTRSGQAKVADFGLARALAEASWTEPLVGVLGTARYLPPEVLEGEAWGPTGDLYSLGLVLAEAVSGVPVFSAESRVAVLAGRLMGPPPLPSGLGSIGEVISRATAPDPRMRYPDALAMEAALAPIAGGSAIEPAGVRGRGGEPTRHAVDGSTAGPTGIGQPEPADLIRSSQVRGERRPHRRWVAAAALALVALVGAVPLWVFVLGARSVADVRNLDIQRARNQLSSMGLSVTVASAIPSYTVPAGSIVATDPPSGTRVRWHATVRLFPSKGLPTVDVPTVTGKPLAEALRALSASQLRAGRVKVVASSAPSTTVLDQGSGVRSVGDAVTLSVSSGLAAPAVVPSLVQESRSDAESKLVQAGLRAQVQESFSDDVPKEVVISQDIDPGARVRPGSVVNLVVSKGPDLVVVPDVRGATVSSALDTLRAAGLDPQVVALSGQEFVLKTDPDRGTSVHRRVRVIVYAI
jgi:eukaryotic-like serine/threonine-protein kinase